MTLGEGVDEEACGCRMRVWMVVCGWWGEVYGGGVWVVGRVCTVDVWVVGRV